MREHVTLCFYNNRKSKGEAEVFSIVVHISMKPLLDLYPDPSTTGRVLPGLGSVLFAVDLSLVGQAVAPVLVAAAAPPALVRLQLVVEVHVALQGLLRTKPFVTKRTMVLLLIVCQMTCSHMTHHIVSSMEQLPTHWTWFTRRTVQGHVSFVLGRGHANFTTLWTSS